MTGMSAHLLRLARIADDRCDGEYTQRVAAAILRSLPVEHEADVLQRRALLVQALQARASPIRRRRLVTPPSE